jgi:hypothetical protein
VNVRRHNFWTAILGSGLCVILIGTISLLSVDSASDYFKSRPSTFFSDRTGTRALLLILQQIMPATAQWRRPLSELPLQTHAADSTLIVMGPDEPLTESEAAVLDKWIAAGGQMILAASKEWQIRKPFRSGGRTKEKKEAEEFISQGYLARHGLQPGTNTSGADAAAEAVTKNFGAGRIVFIPDSYAFSNSTLRTTDNAVWMVSRATEWNDAESKNVFIDEYHHGFGERRAFLPLLGTFLSSPWGFMTMQLALAGLVFMLGTRRRFGRPVEELPIERTSPIEAVEALGGLFETARARVLSVRTIHQYLNVQLTALFGYAIDLSNPAVRERIASRSSLRREQLDSYAAAVKQAIDGEVLSDAELIRIAREATTISRSFSHGNARQHSGRSAAAG